MLYTNIALLFVPIEVKSVKLELHYLFKNYFKENSPLTLGLTLHSLLLESKDIHKSMKDQKRSAHEVALTIVNNLTARMLCSGKYHIFFGTLDSDRGESLYSVFEMSLNMLSINNYLTAEEAADTLKNVNLGIATIG